MNIAVFSDTRLPTDADYPGHGLGKINLAIANGLKERGHTVTLFGGWGSKFDGTLVTGYHEKEFISDVEKFDVVIDGGHDHEAGRVHPDAPIINVSHDREAKPGINAVYVSEAHREWHKDKTGRVIHNGINPDDYFLHNGHTGDYLVWLGHFHPPKGPLAAVQVAQLTGLPVKAAGYGDAIPGIEFVGAVSGRQKMDLIREAKAMICPFAWESAGLVALEAAACGVPVIGFDLAGLPEYIAEGVTGFLVDGVDAMANAVNRVGEIDGEKARQWVIENRSVSRMVDEYEKLAIVVAGGERW